jgi:uncharacterized membrane protein YeaQ/YmgE (transglycosylase-associated protein family)
MNKIQRSWKLMKAAFAVLFREKRLFLFPAIESTLALVVLLFFVMPVIFYPTGHPVFTAEHWSVLGDKISHWFNLNVSQKALPKTGNFHTSSFQPWAGHPWTAVAYMFIYFVSMFMATFSNVAFYHEIMQALNGNAVSIRRGYRFACERWRAILLWSLFAGLVGYLIRTVQERMGFLGEIVTGLMGFVWSMACIFIIPTLVRDTDTANPLKLLRNSAGTLKRTWGELIIGFAGLELAFSAMFVFVFLTVLVIFGVNGYFSGTYLRGTALWLMGGGIAIVILMAFLSSWVSSIVNPVYRCALYIYATEGVVPGSFDQELMDSAWKVKKQS